MTPLARQCNATPHRSLHLASPFALKLPFCHTSLATNTTRIAYPLAAPQACVVIPTSHTTCTTACSSGSCSGPYPRRRRTYCVSSYSGLFCTFVYFTFTLGYCLASSAHVHNLPCLAPAKAGKNIATFVPVPFACPSPQALRCCEPPAAPLEQPSSTPGCGACLILRASTLARCVYLAKRAPCPAPHPLFHPDGPTETHTVRGTRLVVISARAQWGYKVSREVTLRMPHFRGRPRALYPGFGAGCSISFVGHAEDPVASDVLS